MLPSRRWLGIIACLISRMQHSLSQGLQTPRFNACSDVNPDPHTANQCACICTFQYGRRSGEMEAEQDVSQVQAENIMQEKRTGRGSGSMGGTQEYGIWMEKDAGDTSRQRWRLTSPSHSGIFRACSYNPLLFASRICKMLRNTCFL